MMKIVKARTEKDIADVTELAWAFIDLLRERYPEREAMLQAYLAEQRFEEMLANFQDHFCPPVGECLLARMDGLPVGIVMLKPVTKKMCEMNRMFVRVTARGKGIGRMLCEALIIEARALGYTEMRLGALDRHVEALPLYRSLGFAEDPEPPAHAAGDPGVISLRRML